MQAVIERVINLLIYLLESPSPVTADQIRQTVAGYDQGSDEAFHRMFERDKDVLRRLGVPLEMQALDVWEVDFGYIVDPDEYALPDPHLTPDEKAALAVAARMVRLGESSAGFSGLLKLGGVERGMGLEPMGADLGAEADLLGDLFRAITEKRRIHFTYRGESRTLDPYGLAHRRGHWYLAGGTPGGERVYRVDRMVDPRLDAKRDSFTRPRGFKIRELMRSQPWETGLDLSIDATVRFDESVGWWAARTIGVEPPENGDLVVDIPVSNRDAFVGWILSFGAAAEVSAPDELRLEIIARVEQALSTLP